MALTKQALFKRKAKITKVRIESMDDDVYIKEFMVGERNELRGASDIDHQTLVIILGVCDKDGTPLFTKDDVEDIKQMPQVLADELLFAVINTNEAGQQDEAAKK